MHRSRRTCAWSAATATRVGRQLGTSSTEHLNTIRSFRIVGTHPHPVSHFSSRCTLPSACSETRVRCMVCNVWVYTRITAIHFYTLPRFSFASMASNASLGDVVQCSRMTGSPRTPHSAADILRQTHAQPIKRSYNHVCCLGLCIADRCPQLSPALAASFFKSTAT